MANENDVTQFREIRLNIVMRTARQEKEGLDNSFQITENREPVSGTDGFRRRVHTATVRPRNVGRRYPL